MISDTALSATFMHHLFEDLSGQPSFTTEPHTLIGRQHIDTDNYLMSELSAYTAAQRSSSGDASPRAPEQWQASLDRVIATAHHKGHGLALCPGLTAANRRVNYFDLQSRRCLGNLRDSGGFDGAVNHDYAPGRGSGQSSVGAEHDSFKLRFIQYADRDDFGVSTDRSRRVGNDRARTGELVERLATDVVHHQIVAGLGQVNSQILALLAKPDEAGFHCSDVCTQPREGQLSEVMYSSQRR